MTASQYSLLAAVIFSLVAVLQIVRAAIITKQQADHNDRLAAYPCDAFPLPWKEKGVKDRGARRVRQWFGLLRCNLLPCLAFPAPRQEKEGALRYLAFFMLTGLL